MPGKSCASSYWKSCLTSWRAYLRSGRFFPSTLDPVKIVFLYDTLMIQHAWRTLWRKTLPLKPGFHTRKQWERRGKQNILGFVQWKRPLILLTTVIPWTLLWRTICAPGAQALEETLCTDTPGCYSSWDSASLPVYVSVWIPGDWFWDNPTLLTLLLPVCLYYFFQSGPFHNGSSSCLFTFCDDIVQVHLIYFGSQSWFIYVSENPLWDRGGEGGRERDRDRQAESYVISSCEINTCCFPISRIKLQILFLCFWVYLYIYILNYICGNISVGQKLKQAWLGSLFRVLQACIKVLICFCLSVSGIWGFLFPWHLSQSGSGIMLSMWQPWGCSRCDLASVVRHVLSFLESMLGTMLVRLTTVTVLDTLSSVVLFWWLAGNLEPVMVSFLRVLRTTNDRLALLPIILWERYHNPTPIFGHEGKGLMGKNEADTGLLSGPVEQHTLISIRCFSFKYTECLLVLSE